MTISKLLTLGNSSGDEVLIVVAVRLRAGVRPLGSIGRLTSEEFLVVLAEGGIDYAVWADKSAIQYQGCLLSSGSIRSLWPAALDTWLF